MFFFSFNLPASLSPGKHPEVYWNNINCSPFTFCSSGVSKYSLLENLVIHQHLFIPQLAGYENDFKIERQEKVKALSDRDQASRERDQIIQRYEHLKQEHIGLRQNIERMYSEAQKQQVKVIHLQFPYH